MLAHILVFLSAALFEGCYLGWVMSASRGRALRAALFSVATGGLSLYGVASTVHDTTKVPALLLGYFVSSFVVVKLTDRERYGKETG